MANHNRTRKDGTPIRRKPRKPRDKTKAANGACISAPDMSGVDAVSVKRKDPAKPAKKTPPAPRQAVEVPFFHSPEHMAKMTAAAAEAHAIFATAEEFEAAATAYFEYCDANGLLYGEAGLCLALSKGNRKGCTVTLKTLRNWYDGEACEYLQDAVQRAYLRIQAQIETDPTYREKGMVPRSIFLQKQTRLGGYQDRVETKNDSTVKVIFGSGVDESDFK